MLRLDRVFPSVVWVNAGHCPGYVIDHAGRIAATLASEGYPLGLELRGAFPAGPPIPLNPGDVLFLYTDGITEAGLSGSAKLFGIERALAIVRQARHGSPETILESLFCAVREFAEPQGLVDDATAVVIKVRCGD
jgi:sigma-B regulation protein RsbU (phosphoserine phosphatase)